MVLVDTSVWIESFRARHPLQIEELVDFDEVVTCLPVIQEVLQGFRNERAYRIAAEAMRSLPVIESPLELPLFEEAIGLYRTARRQGFTVRSSVDCLIAACALRHGLTVLHRDRDYAALAKISSLQQRAV
jgi:hypothetical protein